MLNSTEIYKNTEPRECGKERKEKEKRGLSERGSDQGMYLTGKPSGSVRTLIRESGTFLFSCFRISDRGRLIPDVGTTSS